MKKTGLLNRPLSDVIAGMGHTDLLVVADAGLPTPPGVPCIDLAVVCEVPPVLDVLRAVAVELAVEGVTVADELLARDDPLRAALRELFPEAVVDQVPHEEFKRLTARARAVVRTGECTPYNNVILTAGVIF